MTRTKRVSKLSTFLERLDYCLEQSGYTQTEVSEAVCGSKGTLGNWRARGTENIRATTLFAVCDFLGVDAYWLWQGIGEAPDYKG